MKLNLGCGPHALAGWRNLDLDAYPEVERCDLSRGILPAAAGSVDFVASEHFIEHITQPQAIALFREIHRVLKPGGVFRVSTPDLRRVIYDYLQGKVDRWAPTWVPQSPCQMVNEGMREWGHQFLYDFDELEVTLKAAGFAQANIQRAEWLRSSHPELCDLEVRPYCGDLIVEASRG